MQNEQSTKIVERFFEAIYDLKEKKVLRGKNTFVRRYNINSRHLWTLEQNKSRDMFQLIWLSYLVMDYDVSADWILTGKGKMYTKEPRVRLGFTNKPKESE
jgi:hypothetical protein